jgi:hypothetical protein
MVDALLRHHFVAQAPTHCNGAKPFYAPQAVDDMGRPLIEVTSCFPMMMMPFICSCRNKK